MTVVLDFTELSFSVLGTLGFFCRAPRVIEFLALGANFFSLESENSVVVGVVLVVEVVYADGAPLKTTAG